VTSEGNARVPKAVKDLNWSKLSAAQRRTLARTGKVGINVRVLGGGTVTVRGRGTIAGRMRTVGTVTDTVLKETATTVKLSFKLSSAARRELSRRHRLRATLEARLSGLSTPVASTINLTPAR
jgi:MOSC domain-containing protein YiiM